MKEKNIYNKLIFFAGCIFLGLVLIQNSVYYFRIAPYYGDADFASEMVLGRLLADRFAIVTPAWKYSTEIRVFNVPLIYSLVFRFTNDWTMVKWVAAVIVFILFGLSIIYFCVNFYFEIIDRKSLAPYIPAMIGCLLMPLSSGWQYIMNRGLSYYSYTFAVLVTLGMYFHYDHVYEKRGTRTVLMILNILFSAGTAFQGPRMIMMLYAPAFAVAFLYMKKRPHIFRICFVSCISAGISYVINVALVFFRIIYRYNYSHTSFGMQGLNRLKTLFVDMQTLMGGTGILGSGTVVMILGAVALSVLIIKGKGSGRFISIYFLISLLLYLVLYMFTTMDYAQRYSIPFIFLIFPMIFIAASLMQDSGLRYVADALILFMIILMIRNVTVSSLTPDYSNANSEFVQISDYLTKEGVCEGYSTYWQSTVTAMLTNGRIETWSIYLPDSADEPVFSSANLNMFLQRTDHETRLPEGRKFLLLDNSEAERLSDRLPADHLKLETASYKLYIFEAGEEL